MNRVALLLLFVCAGHQWASTSATGLYMRRNDGEKCSSGKRIRTASKCRSAAKDLGLTYSGSWRSRRDTPGCIFANDGRRKVYFNTDLNAYGSNRKYAEICNLGLYMKRHDGEKCSSGKRIRTASKCSSAARELGLSYSGSWRSRRDTPGCIFANDGRKRVYFNTDLNAYGSNRKYAEICKIGLYMKRHDGEKCSRKKRIRSLSKCKSAAQELGLPFSGWWRNWRDSPGCVFANDGRRKVYFNTDLQAYGSNRKYAEICRIDFNECKVRNGGCSHTCVNTMGSFRCTCRRGYTLAGNKKTCYDTNECRVRDGGCGHTCVNTQGSFRCTCRTGYTLSGNKKSCYDTNECSVNNGGCSHRCVNTMGSFKCTCPTGYVLGTDRKTCSDTNECSVNNGGCSHRCVNTIGSFKCTCLTGYVLGTDRKTCSDVDECFNGVHSCHAHAACTNTAGSYTCSCKSGYQGDGRSCKDAPCVTPKGKTCIFPFTYKGKTCPGPKCCNLSNNSRGSWCATKVDAKGNYVRGNYAYCKGLHCE